MQFNSFIFLFLFLPLALAGWHVLNIRKHNTAAILFLIAMSVWFYGYTNPVYLILIALSIVVNYSISHLLNRNTKAKKFILILGIVINLSALGYFKYRNFFVENVNLVLGTDFTIKKLILPLGISFFTLQQIAFLVDRYRGDAPHYGFLDYSLFVLYFPKLMSGPIPYHDELIPEFHKAGSLDTEKFTKGLFRFVLGLSKKILLADVFALYTNRGVGNVYALDMPTAWLTALAYSLELYFDFSGYCDMALGISEMLGISLPENFNAPYKAKSVKDFWKRWHVTLTRFLTKYVYIPMGGSRKGKARWIINTLIVFGISGLWHGANWNFILWGLLHGIAILISGAIHKRHKETVLSHALTMIFVVFAWGIFRIEDNTTLSFFVQKMFTPRFSLYIKDYCSVIGDLPELYIINKFLGAISPNALMVLYEVLSTILLVMAITFMKSGTVAEKVARRDLSNVSAGYLAILSLLFLWCIMSFSNVTTFLYFTF